MPSTTTLFPSLRALTTRLFSRPSPLLPQSRTLTTTPPNLALSKASIAKLGPKPGPGQKPKGGSGPGGKGGQPTTRRAKRKGEVVRDPRMINLLRHLAILSPQRIPAPLRMARNRYLRHWTIHRAWLLFRRQQREAREKTWMRQYQSMNRACEELRLTSGPGTREKGYLFRMAMEKKGVYGLKGVPIEYARAQTETPARVPWDHEWKRD
ncbi:hypothetical protein B0T21DRAFT_283265 [Apiosordaria backusii]|uniref:Large ribosomal subunit protein mL40 n=1 Tax=Apiosordaria backusii TaxID=314023 RepID=A0AA40K154_9PEZI|nr:hypothetical protein B0T21DRAFT_283265 [Apiosordaria backusii]